MKLNPQGIRLKQLRKKSNITQEQLAKYLGVDQTMVAKLENGTRHLSASLIEKICDLFGCSAAYLLGKDAVYSPPNFAFNPNELQTEDLEGIAAIGKIVTNIRYMNNALQ